jgi:proline utilization trans-activator
MRIALIQGMHTDMPIENLGESLVQRCRKIWWTVYVLDRQMTGLMGLPQSIRDNDISCQIPTFVGSAQRAAALNMQIKLARIYAEIARSMLVIKLLLDTRLTWALQPCMVPKADYARNSFLA